MKTTTDIIDYYRMESKKDLFGFMGEVLLPYLSADEFRDFAKENADLSDWKQTPLIEEAVKAEMKEYMEFAWDKVDAHRGISAMRSIEKMQAWLWLLEDEELLAFSNIGSNYTNYGAPILMKISQKYDFPIPDDEGLRNMAQGKPCYDGCDQGCGKSAF